MASFTDKSFQFNPYIQELPVQEMVQVGMAKQAQYNQGVEKIQNYVDRIAGLDISKPQHKQYLQSKLGELGSRLKTVAAGDFSNQQLVNSVSGMTAQVAQDSIIQNAVYSTSVIKKGYSELETARKQGKSSKNNEDYYENYVNEWMSNPDLKTPFTEKYTSYKDVDKKLRGLADELKKQASETSIDNPFVRNDKGEELYFSTKTVIDPVTKKKVVKEVASTDPTQGEKRLDLDMLRIKVKGTPAQKILDTFYDSLDSNDVEQLKINSWARYRGSDVKSFQDDIMETYESKKEILNQQILDVTTQLQNPNLSSTDKAVGQVLLKKLTTQYNDGSLDKEMNKDLADLNKNIEKMGLANFKYKLYTDNHLTRLAKDLSNRTYVEERLTNPAWQANQERLKFQFDQYKFKDESARGWANINLSKDRLDWEKLVKTQELTGTSLSDVSESAIGTGKNMPTVLNQQDELKGILSQKSQLQSSWAKSLYPDLKDGKQISEAFADLEYQYRTNPHMNLNANQKEYLKQATTLDNDASRKINAISSAMKVGPEKALQNAIGKLGGSEIKLDNGSIITPNEIVDVLSKIDKFKAVSTMISNTYTGPGGGASIPVRVAKLDAKAATNFFRTYEGGKYSNVVSALIKKEAGQSLSGQDKNIISKFDKASGIYNNELKKVPQYESDYLAKISPNSISQKATLSPDLVKADELALNRFITKASDTYATLDKKPTSWDNVTIGQWWNSRGNAEAGKVNWVFEKFRDGSAQVIATRGTERQIIPVTATDMANYFPQAQQSSPFNSIRDDIYTSPNRTTNLAGKVDDNPYNAVNSRFSGYDLPQMQNAPNAALFRFDINGSPDNTGKAETDKFVFVGYVKDPKNDTWKRKELSNGYEGEGKMLNIMRNLNPSNIQQAITNWK